MVGSLLRPTSVRYAVEEFYAGGHSAVLADERVKDRTELRALEDEAIRDAVRRQIDLGLDVVTERALEDEAILVRYGARSISGSMWSRTASFGAGCS